MSNVKLAGNVSGTGSVTIASPNTNSDFTITLPAVSGTMATTETAGFPSGTVLTFVQTAAPTGWTKSTTHNNKALRVVSGTASSGGSVAFTTAFGTPSVSGSLSGSIGSTTLSTSQIPSHAHTVPSSTGTDTSGSTVATGYDPYAGGGTKYTSYIGGSGSHDHSFSGSLSGATAAINVQYVDVIIATKD